ncbi:MAG: SusC/RagA family TonB-linked outer membrane protein, partial [Bacteroidota bacterium]|nr:SusC/RagA family TonB-linked outer membrane protein [Bacteroidota bacterium]
MIKSHVTRRVLYLTLFVLFYGHIFAQISLSIRKQKIKQIIPVIEKISGYNIFYINEMPDLNLEKDFVVSNKSISETLDLLFRGTSITYQIKADKQILLLMKSQRNKDINRTLPEDKKKIKGKVVDLNHMPLIGVLVREKGESTGATTNSAGEFVLDVRENSTLIFSYLGYLTQHIAVNDKSTIDVVMADDSRLLNELVVIGYGAIMKKDLTGAVVTIPGEDASIRKTSQLSTALQGAVSGVLVTRDNNAPGSVPSSIRIRGITTIGNSDPLVVVDGVPGDINQVNANEVESISVLKDAASSAIYGSRAASGVILVTTKRAKETGMSLRYSGEFGLEIPTTQPDVVGVTRYLGMTNELRYNDNPSGGLYQAYSEDQVKNWLAYNQTDPNHYPVTDWQDMILKKSAMRQTQVFQISGGAKSVRTLASLTYDNIDGLYADRNYERYMLRVNNDVVINDKLSVTIDFNAKRSKYHQPVYDPLADMRMTPSIYAAVWKNGRIAEGKSGGNPYGLMLLGGSMDRWYTLLGGKASVDYKPFSGFNISAVIAPILSYLKIKSFQKKATYTLADDPNVTGGYLEANAVPYSTTKLYEERDDNYYITSQLIASYKKTVGAHNIDLMGGTENHYEYSETLTATRDGYTLSSYPYLDTGPESLRDNGGSGKEYAYRSWFGRLMYNYAGKYLLQANARNDGSSRFAKKYRWGIFPAFFAGWVMTEEPVIKENMPDWLSTVKLRASWGALGNERIGDFPYLATI